MKRAPFIGIFGGTFDPIHVGHLLAAEAVREGCGLDRVLFVVDHAPPHKRTAPLASPRDRLAMARLAVRGNPSFSVLDAEIRRGGRSYTVDTVRWVRERFPRAGRPALVVGADLVDSLSTWKDWRELLSMVRLVLVGRGGERPRATVARRVWRFVPLDCNVSSTEIRRRLRRKESVRYMVPDSVLRYIRRCRLYAR
jgi:nicotinate-nucleotide adenylyltransferase